MTKGKGRVILGEDLSFWAKTCHSERSEESFQAKRRIFSAPTQHFRPYSEKNGLHAYYVQ
jgi:hypothetical protein